MSEKHTCHRENTCTCWVAALEPADDCPIHGCGPAWPPRCCICGKLLPWPKREPVANLEGQACRES